MMKRGLVLFTLFIVVIALPGFVRAEGIGKITKAYQCLDGLVNTTQINLDEAIFTALANVPGNKSWSIISGEKSPTEWCWPKAGCTVKTTAQVALVYKQLGKDTKNITAWLSSKNATVAGFTWYLQTTIDNNEISQCSVNYDGIDRSFSVKDDMKLEGDVGQCLSIDVSGYRFKIPNNCIDKVFSVKCDKGFKINLLYEKSSGGTLYVSSRTESGSANSWKSSEINAKCFKEGSSCNYESSLWAAAALYSTGKNYESFIPYLRVLADDNPKLFPSSFLNYLQGGSQYYSKIVDARNNRPQGRAYWDLSGNKFYDTALAMLSLGSCQATADDLCTNADLKDAATYLLDGQTDKGCWNNNNLKDTAFLLYAGWTRNIKSPSATTTGTGGEGGIIPIIPENAICVNVGGACSLTNCSSSTENTINASCSNSGDVCCLQKSSYNPATPSDCQSAAYYCAPTRISCLENSGTILGEKECATFDKVCCTIEVPEPKTCTEQGGSICQGSEDCDGSIVSSSTGSCCVGTCKKTEQFECTVNTECASNEKCENNKCVSSGTTPPPATTPGSSTWIYVLAILIILIVVAILFRKKIQIWMFNRSKAKGSKGPLGGMPPRGLGGPPKFGRMPPRFGPPSGLGSRPLVRQTMMQTRPVQQPAKMPPSRPASRAPNAKEKEMDETLKKLKKMSE